MQEVHRRDRGLVRALGPWGLAANVLNAIVGSGIFVVPAALAAEAGRYAPAVLLACAAAIGAVALCFAAGCSRVPSSGGPYAYIEAAHGALPAQLVGTMLWLSALLSDGGIASALGGAVAAAAPPPFAALVRSAVVIGVVGGVAAINVRSLKGGARLLTGASAVKLVPLVVFLGVGAGAMHAAHFDVGGAPNPSGIGRAAILAMFAFMGTESALGASGEVVRPARTIPLAIVAALATVTLLYVCIQLIAQGVLGAALPGSAAPLADALGRVGPGWRRFMLAGTALSLFGWLCADLLSTPRLIFACARDGWLPAVLGRTHRRFHTPYLAIAVYAIVAIALALSNGFEELVVLAALAIAPVYVFGCTAAVVLARRRVALAGEPLEIRG
ncbi:MAG: APC family permease, partial [Gammaproteobacteria bacterium]|nr:APC family permease [Gammaproteobacteria bacterium]